MIAFKFPKEMEMSMTQLTKSLGHIHKISRKEMEYKVETKACNKIGQTKLL